MKSCLFIFIAVVVLVGIFASIGTIFFLSSDTKLVEPEPEAVETVE